MIRPILSVALAATLLAACGQKAGEADNTKGPVVAASETPRNEAVDTTPTSGDPGPTAGANSFTEAQAKSAIEGAGYTNVGALTQDANGVWMGKATKAGKEASVAVDYKGAVTAS
ncbi:MAG: hypothetical protein Q7T84_20660 [Phenylobacterium sp.]|uniref:hypothetical protein n=1 Tax=Phenylobacterium sp. TaxID=1871053 RepID=UPI00271937C0|nr:hypothetical protein [Phenylobacterium sp.]MDO9433710.1 hypothetical protein [Phenylobacterium sp.]